MLLSDKLASERFECVKKRKNTTRIYGVHSLLVLIPLLVNINSANTLVFNVTLCESSAKTNCTHQFTNKTSVGEIYSFCKTNTSLVVLNEHILPKMHFDFCNEIPAVFGMPPYKDDPVSFTSSSRTVNVSRTITCGQLHDMVELDKQTATDTHQQQQILYSAIGFDSRYFKNRKSHTETIKKCEEGYKNWLCSFHKLHYNNRAILPCSNVANQVCLNCPAIESSETYGGYSMFSCPRLDEVLCDITNDDVCVSVHCMQKLFNSTFP